MTGEYEDSISWPEAVAPKVVRKLCKASSKPKLPEIILSIMETEFKNSAPPPSYFPFGSAIREVVGGYGFIIGEMQAALRLFRSEKDKLAEVKGVFEIQGIVKQARGIKGVLNFGMDLLDDHRQELKILSEDPSGLHLASHLVGELFEKNKSRWQGAMAAADRYRILHDTALGT